MARTIDSVTQTIIDSKTASAPIFLVSIELSSTSTDNLYLNNSTKNITHDGNTYLPGNQILGISKLQKSLEAKTNSLTINLAGIPATIITAFNKTGIQPNGAVATIYQTFPTSDGSNTTVYEIYKGLVNSHSVIERNTFTEGDVTIAVETKNYTNLILDTTGGRFTSNESLAKYNSGDKSFEFTPSLVNWNPDFGADT